MHQVNKKIRFIYIYNFSSYRAFMKINDDKVFLVEQRKAAGLCSSLPLHTDVLEGAVFDK